MCFTFCCRFDFSATEDEIKEIMQIFDGSLKVGDNFQKTAPIHIPGEQPRTALAIVSF